MLYLYRGFSLIKSILKVKSIHEPFATAILTLPLIQEWQLSVSGERMYPSTGL